MKKQPYQIQTITSVQKINPDPVYLKEKVFKLSSQLNQIQSSIKNEDQLVENIEKNTQQQFYNFGSQLTALRKAFSTLADVMMDEMDSLKLSFQQEKQAQEKSTNQSLSQYVQRLNNVELQVSEIQNQIGSNQIEKQQQSIKIQQQIKQISNESNQFNQLQQSQLDKVMALIYQNNLKIDNLSKEKANLNKEMIELKEKMKETSLIHEQKEQKNELNSTNLQASKKSQMEKEPQKKDFEVFSDFFTSQLNNLKKDIATNFDNFVKDQQNQLNGNLNLFQEQKIIIKNLEAKLDNEINTFNFQKQEIDENLMQITEVLKESQQQIIQKIKNTVLNQNKVIQDIQAENTSSQLDIQEQVQKVNFQIEEINFQSKKQYFELLKKIDDLGYQISPQESEYI